MAESGGPDNDRSAGAYPPYLTVKQAADYLQLNEKKIYALIQEGLIPATRATGKWLFPRKLLDEWLLESTHGGALTDRLILAGAEDPLLAAAVTRLCAQAEEPVLLATSPGATRLGLAMLSLRLANLGAIHWGPAEAAERQHSQLISGYPGNAQWTIVRLAKREQGVLLRRGFAGGMDLPDLLQPGVRWVGRPTGSGSRHFLESQLHHHGLPAEALQPAATAHTEREAASMLARGAADCAAGCRATGGEFGLDFLPLGWEAFDLVMPQAVFFRALFQRLLDTLRSPPLQRLADELEGYDLAPLGRVVRRHGTD